MKQRLLWSAAVVLAAIIVATFGFFFFRDNFSTHYPIKSVSAGVFRSGEIPYWNFYDAGGQPLAGNPNTLTFYPDNLLYLFLPAYIAFNLHFLIHLGIAFFAMRALTKSSFGGALYALSGVAISATALYNLIVAVAAIPLVLRGVERRAPLVVGGAFGLLLLAAEPVTILGALLAAVVIAVPRWRWRDALLALLLAVLIGLPQLIAYGEIAAEVERSVPMSARTALNASLHPLRIAEIFVWPFQGFLNDAGGDRTRLFSTLFLGVIAIPALFSRSRYLLLCAVLLFFALGRYNPLVAALVENVPLTRVARYPEKLAIPLTAALVVLAANYYARSRFQRLWLVVTFAPLLWVVARALPIDWFQPYEVPPVRAARVHVPARIPAGVTDARSEYRLRARALEPLFGAVAGVRYAINASPDGMHALRSRMVVERFHTAPQKYLRLHCSTPAWFVARVISSRDVYEEASIVGAPWFDERTTAVAAKAMEVAPARLLRYRERPQSIEIEAVAGGPALLVVNQTYFRSWVVRSGMTALPTIPVDIDRLGVIVPPGRHRLVLRFGRFRGAVAAAWALSIAALALAAFIEIRNGLAGQVERPAHEDGGDVGGEGGGESAPGIGDC
jgi:hypothetical protein